jgi:hypothetical protein
MKKGISHTLKFVVACSICAGLAGMSASCSDDDPVQGSGPRTITVAPDSSGDASTIQDAVNIANNGDVIELLDGVYSGEGNRDIDFLGKRVTIRSRSGNPDRSVVELPPYSFPYHRAFVFQSGEDSCTVIVGLKIVDGTGGGVGTGANMSADWGPSAISSYGGAIMCRHESRPVFIDCVFVSNEAGFGGIAFSIEGASPRFVGCTFYDNGSMGGLFAGYDATFEFERSLIAFNDGEVVTDGQPNGSATFSCSNIYGNSWNWAGSIADMLGVNGNISRDPLFVDAAVGNLRLDAASPCLPESTGCGLIGAFANE